MVNCKDNCCKSYGFGLEVLTVYIIYLLKFLFEYNDIYNDMTILGELCSISSIDWKRQIVVAIIKRVVLLCGLSSMEEGLILLHVGSSSQLNRTYVYGILRYVMALLVLNTVRAILEDFQEKTNFITSRYCKTLHSIWHNEFAFNIFRK